MSINKINELTEYSLIKRGMILHECIQLEKKIDNYLTNYFCYKEKRAKFFLYILDRTSLDSKISILESILKSESNNDFKVKYKSLIANLREVKDHRNIFAHYMLDTFNVSNIDKFPKEITLVGFRNSTNYINYDDKKFNDLRVKIENCCQKVSVLRNGLFESDSPADPMK